MMIDDCLITADQTEEFHSIISITLAEDAKYDVNTEVVEREMKWQ